MLRKVDRAAHELDPARHACRRLVVDDENGLDAALAIIAEPFRNEIRIDAIAPIAASPLKMIINPSYG